MHTNTLQRCRLLVGGQVQGVGFRPHIYRLAHTHNLTGHVGNTPLGVCIEIQGTAHDIAAFMHDLPRTLPPLARMTHCQQENTTPIPQETAFSITSSTGQEMQQGQNVLISPDVATCVHCLADVDDIHNRRHHYAFTNCTNCGPRYTITHSIPYDRATTSMACFPLCPACHAEYYDPCNRRFHAQPNACPVCGPQVWLVPGSSLQNGLADISSGDVLRQLAELLHTGHIAAIKGLGGFHLACDAHNVATLDRLRTLKHRPHKPLALMLGSVEHAAHYAHISHTAHALLTSPERPVVLCPKRDNVLPDAVAPDTPFVGIMLPYTPLHHILFAHYTDITGIFAAPPALVMTSGNAGGEPICLGNREALRRLAPMADVFLLHNRDILLRVDDSVVMPASPGLTAPIFHRRARGYVPRPVVLAPDGVLEGTQKDLCVLGAGAELKNTLCLTRAATAFVSQHIGDMHNLATLHFYEEIVAHMCKVLEVQPQAVVCDLHPDFLSSRFAADYAHTHGLPLWRLQHHYAHGWSLLAEHQFIGTALVLALDGTGLGEDGSVWGGELLCINTETAEHKRLGRLTPFVLPGGDMAVRQPWRIACALAHALGADVRSTPLQQVDVHARHALYHMLEKNIHCVPTSSAGRLFDAVSALLGLCQETSFEGQAAIRLETAQGDMPQHQGYPVDVSLQGELWEVQTLQLFSAVLDDVLARQPVAHIAQRFHAGFACGMASMAAQAAATLGIKTVGLTGGVMQNATLAQLLPHMLRQHGLHPLMHQHIPANDGGISLGQAAWGRTKTMIDATRI